MAEQTGMTKTQLLILALDKLYHEIKPKEDTPEKPH